ncbi:MAG TPA: hypothetical protein VE959_10905 [Bryobacteraceae bacterium]|nr:hypothetical protein [Bryobacteraceae bacterium]
MLLAAEAAGELHHLHPTRRELRRFLVRDFDEFDPRQRATSIRAAIMPIVDRTLLLCCDTDHIALGKVEMSY